MAQSLTGGCLCGAVRYIIDGAANMMSICHCSRCRRWTGANYSVEVAFLADQIRFTQGADIVKAVEIPGIGPRTFCPICGSCLVFGAMHVPADFRSVPAGTVDDVDDLRPMMHIFVLSKPVWGAVPSDDLPKMRDEEMGDLLSPEEIASLAAVPLADAPSTERPVHGGCLCGGVQYEVTGPFLRANYCHCTRCRMHSGSWGLMQGRVAPEHFRLVAGADLLTNYAEPGHAAKVFCSACGSSVFGGHWPDGKTVSIRFGTLAGDPGIRPSFHTFVGEKAPWDAIDDDLPQFSAGASREEYARLVEGRDNG